MVTPPTLPLVVQLSFAGSRKLFDAEKYPNVDKARFELAVQTWLVAKLVELRDELGLSPHHFICGISQIAIGADTVFTQACRANDFRQSIFLTQHRDEYLSAVGSNGKRDFTPEEEAIAIDLLKSPHIIDERVMAQSSHRETRFREVNMELAWAADVVLCLVRKDAEAKGGGTIDLLTMAEKRRVPALKITVGVGADNLPQFDEEWVRKGFVAPELPKQFAKLKTNLTGVPPLGAYCDDLKAFGSKTAKKAKAVFSYSALVIVGAHFLATTFAVMALLLDSRAVVWLLGVELVLLLAGLIAHQILHWRKFPLRWAMARLAAELARSVKPMAGVQTFMSHLFTLPLPKSLLSLRRTLNILHLNDSRWPKADLAERRKVYIEKRLTSVELKAQIPYYTGELAKAERWSAIANGFFFYGSGLAIIATLIKLLLHLPHETPPSGESETWPHVLGAFAILLPVVAVAALSLAASRDLEARVHIYKDMVDFLKEQLPLLEKADSEHEFAALALETETHLLGEIAAWFSRRSFTGVQ